MSERTVSLTTLLGALPTKTVLGRVPGAVAGLSHDSRKVTPGGVFVAVP